MAEKATVRAKDATEDAVETAKEAGEQAAAAARRIGEDNVQTFKRAADDGASTLRGVTEAADRGYRELTGLGRGNVEAGQAMLRGWQEINRELASYVRAQLGRNIEAGRALARARTLREAFRVQSDYVRASMEKFAEEAGTLSRLTAQLAGGSLTQLQEARATAGAKQVSRQQARG